MSGSEPSIYSQPGSSYSEDDGSLIPPGNFSQTIGTALSKFGRVVSTDTTCSSVHPGPMSRQESNANAHASAASGAMAASEVSLDGDGLSSQGWISVHDASLLAQKTTVMMKNVPVKYTQRKLLREILSAGFHGKMDFIYLPIDPRSRCSRGFAFCNFVSPEVTQEFFRTFHKKFLNSYESESPIEVAAAEIQGFDANAHHYLVVKASRKAKGRDTFGCPTFLRPLPQHLLCHLRDDDATDMQMPQMPDGYDRPGVPPAVATEKAAKPRRQPQPHAYEPKASSISMLSRAEIPQIPAVKQAPQVTAGSMPPACICANCRQTISGHAFCPYCGSANIRQGSTFIGKSFWI